jgi:hypothetical protein
VGKAVSLLCGFGAKLLDFYTAPTRLAKIFVEAPHDSPIALRHTLVTSYQMKSSALNLPNCSTNMENYSHIQLSQSTAIRLLRLLPSEKDSDSLQGELSEFSLRKSQRSTLPYEALSYCWGNDEKPNSISIGNKNLRITQNLHGALQQLRYPDYPRILWIDAICINQDDNEEKQGQIPLMAEIYARAHRVLVWLGEAEADSDIALEEIRIAGEAGAVKELALEADILLNACEYDSDETPEEISIAGETQEAIKQLLERPWFRRIWVRKPDTKSSWYYLNLLLGAARNGCRPACPNYVRFYRDRWPCLLPRLRLSRHR